MAKFRRTREDMLSMLRTVGGIKVFETQGNFVMLEILYGKTARDITNELLTKYQIFIKDLSHKSMYDKREFVSVAVKTPEENAMLVEALKDILKRN